MRTKKLLVFDVGTSSVRSFFGQFDGNCLNIEELDRFYHLPEEIGDSVLWDMYGIRDRLNLLFERVVSQYGTIDSVSLDSWGTDMVALDARGKLLTRGVSTRDKRFIGLKERVFERMSREKIYQRTGIQFLDWNTLYLLFSVAEDHPDIAQTAEKFMFVPDYFLYELSGERICDYSIASTSQMLNPWTQSWDAALVRLSGINKNQLLNISHISRIGKSWIGSVEVCSGCSHDTAAAVAGIPFTAKNELFIIAGSWAMMGIELDRPIISPLTLQYGFSNEGGVDGKIRFLKNSMGMWLVQESRRVWKREGKELGFDEIAAASAKETPYRAIIDVNDPRLQPSGNLPQVIRTMCAEIGNYVPQTVGEIVRVITDSLAFRFRAIKEEIEECTGRSSDLIRIVAGGSMDASLCQSIADVCGCRVIAGPTEASAYGNCATQLIAMGLTESLADARRIISRSISFCVYDSVKTNEIDEKYREIRNRVSTKLA